MTIQRQVLFWVAGFFLFIALIWLLSGVLLPFVAGLAAAYLLDPAADKLEKWGLSRLAATTVITAIFILLFFASLIVLMPVAYEQTLALLEAAPRLAERAKELLMSLSEGRLAQLLAGEGTDIQAAMSRGANSVLDMLVGSIAGLWQRGMAIIGLVSLLFVTPIVAFYMLLDWDNMVERVDGLLPRDHAATIRAIAREIDEVLAGFVRGQGAVCLLLGSFYAIGLSVLGLEFGFIVGAIAGIISFIPYVGTIVGFVLAMIIAVVQFWPDYGWIIAVAGVFGVGQFIEGNFLTPKLVGDRVRLHPLWVMLALFAFGYLFGFVGMLLAVPVAAAMGVLVRFAAAKYLVSSLYQGNGGDDT
ncbi:MAG: AI-2E family transporter [Parvibaculaceae bacterium]|nr:AI-2E family transporter [Parvibaculaceae bacterium]HBM88798.1 AI-2E family transporter [Rhodobiaceae bacterium]